MRIELDAALKRVRRLEVLHESQLRSMDDEKEAQRIAEELGFIVEILMLPVKSGPGQPEARGKVAKALRKKKWPISRIARVLHCCERTVERLVYGY